MLRLGAELVWPSPPPSPSPSPSQVFRGQRGQLRQRYREGQEDQLGALGLVLNVMVLWNTRYLDAALTLLPRPIPELSTPRVAHTHSGTNSLLVHLVISTATAA